MENQETVQPEQDSVFTSDTQAEQPQGTPEVEQEEKQVPLHALQKERQKRQEAQDKVKFYEEQAKQVAAEDDDSRYESVTREELGKKQKETQRETLRILQEEQWIAQNPERAQRINSELTAFLELRPNLVPAINAKTNRYAEAWELMTKLSPKEQQVQQQKARQKSNAPGSPSAMPKAAAMNDSVDLMSMSDAEFNSWRKNKRGGR